MERLDALLEVPAELLVDGAEEALAVEADKADGEGFAGEVDLGATGQVEAAGVHAEVEVRWLAGTFLMGDEAELGAVGDDDGTEGEVVRPDGGDDEAAAVGGEDGSAAAEGVGRGARGGSHDETVARIGGHKVVVNKELGTHEGTVVQSVEGDLVKSVCWELRIAFL